MPWCPKCGTEYREGFTECADCHVPLTYTKPQLSEPEPEPPRPPVESPVDPVLVYEAANPTDAEMICEILQNFGIPTATFARDGGLLKAYPGTSLCGTVIFVGRAQADEAVECLRTWAEQDARAPISEEALTAAALGALSEDELARIAEAAPREKLSANRAFHGMRIVLALLMLLLAVLLIAYGQVQG